MLTFSHQNCQSIVGDIYGLNEETDSEQFGSLLPHFILSSQNKVCVIFRGVGYANKYDKSLGHTGYLLH